MHRYYLRISFLLCALLCIGLAPARAGDVIWDQYIGRGASADVLGGSRYDVQKMDVRLSGTLLSVDVYTNFAGYSGQHGITYGDLLLGHQWSPYGAAPYSGDDAKKTSTVWEYAFVLDNKRNNQGGQGTVYDLHDRQGNGNAYKKQFNYSTDRRNHIVSVKEEGRHGVTTALGTGQWSVEKDDYLSFVFDIAGTDLLRSGRLEDAEHTFNFAPPY